MSGEYKFESFGPPNFSLGPQKDQNRPLSVNLAKQIFGPPAEISVRSVRETAHIDGTVQLNNNVPFTGSQVPRGAYRPLKPHFRGQKA